MKVTINGTDIRVAAPEVTGAEKAPALFFVHGAGGDANVWNAQADYFRGKRLCYRIELSGHGESEGSGEEDVTAHARCAREVIGQVLQSGPHVLVGHSMGGAIIQELAVDPPAGLKGIVLVGSGAKLGVAGIIFKMLKEDVEGFFRSIDQAAFASKTPPALRKRAIDSMRQCPASVILKDFVASNNFDIRDRLDKIRLPVLALCGENDQLTPVKYSQYLKENLDKAHLEIIPHAGHMVMFEQPELVNKAIEKFLSNMQV